MSHSYYRRNALASFDRICSKCLHYWSTRIVLGIYRIRRMASWLDPWAAYDGVGYQIIQGWIALHTGGVTGTGLGNNFKATVLPEPWTDFIAAVIGEELGFLGLLFIMSLYIGFLWRD